MALASSFKNPYDLIEHMNIQNPYEKYLCRDILRFLLNHSEVVPSQVSSDSIHVVLFYLYQTRPFQYDYDLEHTFNKRTEPLTLDMEIEKKSAFSFKELMIISGLGLVISFTAYKIFLVLIQFILRY